MHLVTIYTDGSCHLHDSGRGGYGALLLHKNHKKEIYGGYTGTTNNRMELLACIKALEALKTPCIVTLYSDSRYVVDAVNKHWLKRWVSTNFKRTKNSKNSIKNIDLWKRLLPLLDKHSIEFVWVRGHNGTAGNERADELAEIGSCLKILPKDTRI